MACHIQLESSWRGLQLCFIPHLNSRFTQEVIGFQSCRRPNFENFETTNLEVLGQNDIWVLASWLDTNNTIRGKVVASPSLGRGESYEFGFDRGSSLHQKCSNYALTNLLFGLCTFMWTIDPIVTCFSPHPGAPTRPSTFEVLWAREHTPTPHPSIVFTLNS